MLPKNVEVDPRGDLTILAASKTACTRVLDPQWDVRHLLALLRAIHGQHQLAAQPMSGRHLYKTMMLVKKFGLYDAIKPCTTIWHNCAKEEMQKSGYIFDQHVHLAWEFRTAQTFATIAMSFALP